MSLLDIYETLNGQITADSLDSNGYLSGFDCSFIYYKGVTYKGLGGVIMVYLNPADPERIECKYEPGNCIRKPFDNAGVTSWKIISTVDDLLLFEAGIKQICIKIK